MEIALKVEIWLGNKDLKYEIRREKELTIRRNISLLLKPLSCPASRS
jgi:hypothetical protein